MAPLSGWRKFARDAWDFNRSEQSRRVLLVVVAILFAVILVNRTLRDGVDLSSLAAMISALVALVAIHQSRQSLDVSKATVDEARDARLAQSRPQVLVSFEVEDNTICAVVGHYGGGPARNVRFNFHPPLKNHQGDDIGAKPPFATGIAMVVPGHRQRVQFADFGEYYLYFLIDESPQGIVMRASQFALTISLSDPLANDREYVTTYVLELEHLLKAVRSPWEPLTPGNPRFESSMRLFGSNQPIADILGSVHDGIATDIKEPDETAPVGPG